MADLLTLSQLEDSKIFVHPKSETLRFKHPMDYLEPFLNKFQDIPVEWTFQADDKVINAEKTLSTGELNVDGEGVQNVAYGTILAKAKLPESYSVVPNIDSLFRDMTGEIGLVYNLNSLKPEMRLYKGKRISYCSNGCIFGADNITNLSITGNYHRIYDDTVRYIDNSLGDVQKYKRIAEYMYEQVLNKNQIYEMAGELLFFAKKNKELGINPVSDAISSLMDSSSRYSIIEDKTTLWNMYNSVTESIKKSNILTESTKVMLLQKVFVKDISLLN
jgi:hypothetical protein